jgi:valyl-tRNA synthetase
VTEEVWSWWRERSVHRASWPSVEELDPYSGNRAVLTESAAVLSAVRKAKSDAKVSMRAEVDSVSVTAGPESIGLVRQAENDLKAAARAIEVLYSEGEFAVEVVLSPN